MAYDFPDAPTEGQEFDTGDAVYTYTNGAWDIKSGAITDYVLKAGDTMTGKLHMESAPGTGKMSIAGGGSAANGGLIEWHNPDGSRKAFLGWGAPTEMFLELESATKCVVKKGEFQLDGEGTATYIRTLNKAAFAFNTTDNNAYQTFMHCGGIQLQYKQGGNNDGQFQLWTSNGGYTDAYVFYTTVASAGPGIVVNGNVSAGSLTSRGGGSFGDNVSFTADNDGIIFYGGGRITKVQGSGLAIYRSQNSATVRICDDAGGQCVNIATTALTRSVEDQIGDAIAPLLKRIADLEARLKK